MAAKFGTVSAVVIGVEFNGVASIQVDFDQLQFGWRSGPDLDSSRALHASVRIGIDDVRRDAGLFNRRCF